MTSPLFVVDAFTDTPLAGNPAAVTVLPGEPDAAWMQRVAREMNQSETAFVWPDAQRWQLRWFTPEAEVNLCGHATLATAHVLWSGAGGGDLPEVLAFETRSGTLTARRVGAEIELDFPAEQVEEQPAPDGLLAALGVRDPVFVGRTPTRWLVELAGAQAVRDLRPDLGAVRSVPPGRVIVTARGADSAGLGDFDIVSRYFAPGIGVPEDPVTGSAHCSLAGYWAPRLGKTVLRAYQASPRGGQMRVELAGERVLLRGGAVTVARGELLV